MTDLIDDSDPATDEVHMEISEWGFQEGDRVSFFVVHIDMQGSSAQHERYPSVQIQQMRTNLNDRIDELVHPFGAHPGQWAGDGKLIFAPAHKAGKIDRLVEMAITIFEFVDTFNELPITGNSLLIFGEVVKLRIICTTAEANYSAASEGLILGQEISRVVKAERELADANHLTITESAWKDIGAHALRTKFERREGRGSSALYVFPKVSELRFCRHDCVDALSTAHKPVQVSTDSQRDEDSLTYILINSQKFNATTAVVREQLRSLSKSSQIHDATVWSLLGASELLLRFRARSEVADRIRDELRIRLYDLLEPQIGHKGLVYIGTDDERVTDGGTPRKGNMFIRSHVNLDKCRSSKAFIRAHFKGSAGRAAAISWREGILTVFAQHSDICGSVAFSRPLPHEDYSRYVLLELIIPCGHMSRLSSVSRALESLLRDDLFKETYVAYDMWSAGDDELGGGSPPTAAPAN